MGLKTYASSLSILLVAHSVVVKLMLCKGILLIEGVVLAELYCAVDL